METTKWRTFQQRKQNEPIRVPVSFGTNCKRLKKVQYKKTSTHNLAVKKDLPKIHATKITTTMKREVHPSYLTYVRIPSEHQVLDLIASPKIYVFFSKFTIKKRIFITGRATNEKV